MSWFQAHADRSLALIERCDLDRAEPILDIGGGASTLVDDLLDRGHTDLTVLDVAESALTASQARLGPRAGQVRWITGDVLTAALPRVQLWHDRAVLHFLIDPIDRARYVEQLEAAVIPTGHVIIATFAPDGPDRCSGLPVIRFSAEALGDLLGSGFQLVQAEREEHRTPIGRLQAFTYTRFVRL